MGKYPITQAQWKAVASLPKIESDLNPDPSNFKGDDRPVEQLSWYDAVEFCKRLSQKLEENTDYLAKPNGNMPAVPEGQHRFILARRLQVN